MRVIGGTLGGRRLTAPRGRTTRPTSDRVREALFMALEPLVGLRVVDLFAGSGALGIEALSRGAQHADFVERDPVARRALDANLSLLGLHSRARVWALHLPRGLKRIRASLAVADLILMDPPYDGSEARTTLEALVKAEVLRPEARVVVEHHARDPLPDQIDRLVRTRERRYGQTHVSTYLAESRPRGGSPQEEEDRDGE